jgi:cellulose synthase/poly-beta-1,6-N-acetylglucosamine synthase-like glycosyltransferase
MEELVTIVIPCNGKRPEMLKEAIASVKRQSYKNIELIIENTPNSQYVNHFNGLQKAKGTILHFLHDDDWLTDNSVELALKALKDCDFIHGKAHETDGRDYEPEIKFPTLDQLAEENMVHFATCYYRTQALMDVGIKDMELLDWVISLDLILKGYKIGYCNDFLVHYRIHEEQVSKSNRYKKIDKPSSIQYIKENYANREVIL